MKTELVNPELVDLYVGVFRVSESLNRIDEEESYFENNSAAKSEILALCNNLSSIDYDFTKVIEGDILQRAMQRKAFGEVEPECSREATESKAVNPLLVSALIKLDSAYKDVTRFCEDEGLNFEDATSNKSYWSDRCRLANVEEAQGSIRDAIFGVDQAIATNILQRSQETPKQ